MSRPVIVVGDRTSHGGVVLTGSPFSDVNGKGIARIGDKVTCPQKGHGSVTTIVTGDLTDMIDGSPVARHGDKTACGATLISSQMLTYTDDGNGANTGGGSPSKTSACSLPRQISAVSALNSDNADDLELYYEIVDAQTEAPIDGMTYKLLSGDHVLVSDKAFSDGKTLTFPAKDHLNLSLIAWKSGGVR